MGRNIPSGLLLAMYRLYSEPITLIELYLTSPYTSISHYYCANNQDISFGGNTYTAIAAKRSSIKSEEGTVLQEITVQMDNIDLEFKALIASGMLNRKRVDLQLVFNNFLSNPANYITLFSGYLDAPSGDNRWVNLLIKPFPIFDREYPRRLFQVQCNWAFCDTQCGLTLSNYAINTTIAGGTGSVYINVPTMGIADGYFLPGYLLMTSGDLLGQVRPILWNGSIGGGIDQIQLRVSLEGTPEVGNTVTFQKLCSKNATACQAFSNYINYGGFPHVPIKPVI